MIVQNISKSRRHITSFDRIPKQYTSIDAIIKYNRDINAVDIVVRDKTTGAINATLTVDHRLFSEEGRKQIADEIANAPENLK